MADVRQLHVLVIEDSLTDQEIIRRGLAQNRRVECVVTAHQTLDDGLSALRSSEFDIILLDLLLPDSSGLDSLRAVMQTSTDVPVIVLSGSQDEQTTMDVVAQGAQDFLTKGYFEADLLVRSILYAIQRKQLELRLQRANDELEQRVEERASEIRLMEEDARRREEEMARAARLTMLGEMMTGLAHEVNQPLMSIVAFASTAQQLVADEAPHSELVEPLGRIMSGATLAGEIIRRLRQMVRRRDPLRGRLHLNNVVREAMDYLTRETESRNVGVDLNLAHYLPVVAGDRIQLQQVVLNLVSNALQAIDRAGNRRNGRAHRVTLETVFDSSSLEVVTRITNTGPQIPDDQMSRVFDAFYTTRQEGLGLGLAISKSIVESHGGRIEVKQAADVGVTFLFTVPSQSIDTVSVDAEADMPGDVVT